MHASPDPCAESDDSPATDTPPAGPEWPTIGVAVAIYAGFATLGWYHALLPWWVVLPLGGYLVAWHGSLQHEAVHGHPFASHWLNELVVLPSLWLWLPYRLYRRTHLDHHHTPHLTVPGEDPESYYVSARSWQRLAWPLRRLLDAHNTACGRLLLGPGVLVWLLLLGETRRVARGDFSHAADWLMHALGVAVVLAWVLAVCRIPLAEYLVLYVYPGISLTLLRSFLEHQAHREPGKRTVIVESGPLMSLLYLNNNLHALHHAEPRLPWYVLQKRFARCREELLAENRCYRFPGYAAIVMRYLFRSKEPVVHPVH